MRRPRALPNLARRPPVSRDSDTLRHRCHDAWSWALPCKAFPPPSGLPSARAPHGWARLAQSPDRDASLTAGGGGVWLLTFVSAGAVSAHGVPSRIAPSFCSWECACRAARCARVSALNTHFADALSPEE